MKYTVISYYTRNTPYEQEVKNLIQSLNKFKIPHDIRFIDSLGSWQANTFYKARFIRDMIQVRKEAGDEAVVWLDADAVVLRPLEIFDNIDTDTAFYFYSGSRYAQRTNGRELISATMFFRINNRVVDLLDRWIEKNKNQADGGLEQWNLHTVLDKWRADGGTVSWLPQSYCRLFDYPEDPRCVVQNQASRRFRGVIGDD